MDILNMVYYVTVCNYRNITKAADVLHISQPALSRRIMAIEDELQIQLLERKGNTFTLTQAGEVFLQEAEEMIKQHNAMLKKIDKFRNQNSIRIGFSHNLYLRPFIDCICKLKNALPDSVISFSEKKMKTNVEDLRDDHLDIIYTTLGEVDGLPGISYQTALVNDAAILVPKGHRLWNRSLIDYEDLIGESICINMGAQSTSLASSRTLEHHMSQGIALNSIAHLIKCSSSSETLMYVATCGYLGIAAMLGNSESTLHPDKVRIIRLNGEHLSFGDTVFAYKTNNSNAKQLVDIMLST